MKTKTIFFILLVISIASCGGKKTPETPVVENKDPYEKIKSMNWIIGKWNMGNGDTLSTETWEMKNDSVFSSISMDVKNGKDTLRYEEITIEQKGNEVFYIPVVKGQNDGKGVNFKLTSAEGQKLVFENPDHDFPKKITYQLSGDTLYAEISGPMGRHDVVMKFPMVRAK